MRHRWNIVLALLACGLGWTVMSWDVEHPPQQPSEVALEAPVPMQEWTVDAGMVLPVVRQAVAGKLPSPGANQITDASKCHPPAKFIQGACWLAVADETPPCDPPPGRERNLWPDNGRCWFPVAQAKGAPSSGTPRPSTLAE